MPASDPKGKNKGVGKSQGKSHSNKVWRAPQEGNDNANKSDAHQETEVIARSQSDLESESQILKAKLLNSSMCKVVDLDAEDDRQATLSLEEKKVERQARFSSSDGAHAKSSIAMKRQSSQGNVTGSTLTTPNTPASEASPSTQPSARSPFAPPPPVAKSSDGARNKAGSSAIQSPAKPRGTAGLMTSSAPTIPATSSTQLSSVQVDATVPSSQIPADRATQPSASVVAPLSQEPLSQIQLLPEHVSEKAAFDALTVPVQSACLKRALETFTEATRKKPRLAAGESAEWEAEYKSLVDWMETNLPTERYHSKVGGPLVACTTEQLVELERCWQQLV